MANDVTLKKVIVPGLSAALATNSEGESNQITVGEIKAIKAAALKVAAQHKLTEADVERVLGECLAQQAPGAVKDPLATAEIRSRTVDEDGWTTIIVNRGKLAKVEVGDKVSIGGVEAKVSEVYPAGCKVLFAPGKSPKRDDVVFHNEPGKAKLAAQAAAEKKRQEEDVKDAYRRGEYDTRNRGH